VITNGGAANIVVLVQIIAPLYSTPIIMWNSYMSLYMWYSFKYVHQQIQQIQNCCNPVVVNLLW